MTKDVICRHNIRELRGLRPICGQILKRMPVNARIKGWIIHGRNIERTEAGPYSRFKAAWESRIAERSVAITVAVAEGHIEDGDKH
jgi:hypothetical protein